MVVRDIKNLGGFVTASDGVYVDLKGANLCEFNLGRLQSLRGVSHADVERSTITDEGLAALLQIPTLREIHASVTQVSCVIPMENTGLEVLGLGFTMVDDDGLTQLGRAKRLRVLSLVHTSVSDRTLEQIRCLTHLERLDLSGTCISDEGLVHLKQLVRLRELNLGSTSVSDRGIGCLGELRKSESRYLQGTRVTSEGLLHLEKLPLRTIVLTGSVATDEAVKRLVRIPTLEKVTLAGGAISEEGIQRLCALPHLSQVNIRGTSVSVAGLRCFVSCKSLVYLFVDNVQATPEVVAMLEREASLLNLIVVD